MKHLKPILIISLITSVAFAQVQDTIRTEERDVTQIEAKARADALADFNKLAWITASYISSLCGTLVAAFGGGAIIGAKRPSQLTKLLGLTVAVSPPFILSGILPVKIPEYREKELQNQTVEYQNIYRSQYTSTIKVQRKTLSFCGPPLVVGTACVLLILGGITGTLG